MDKLTQQEAALYLGQEIEIRFNETSGFDGVTKVDPNVLFYIGNDSHRASFKLLLRPLSDLTDKEEAECQRIELSMRDEMRYLGCEVSARVTQYLLSRGLDILRLIESGKAIDKTKLKN